MLLLWAAGAAGATAHLSADPRVQAARALVEAGRHGEALTALRALHADHPDGIDIAFLTGLAAVGAAGTAGEARRTALLAEAVAAFRSILTQRPGLVRVRLELARAFFLQGEDGLAREHFQRVLAARPPPAMAANIARYLEAIRARRRWTAHAGFALAPDSNINAASGEDTVWIWDLPFRLDEPQRRESGLGVSLWAGGDYRWPLSAGRWLRAGADVWRMDYRGRDHDRTVVTTHAGPQISLGQGVDFGLLATFRRDWRAGRPLIDETGARLEIDARFGPRLTASAKLGLARRAWALERALDGPVADLALAGAWRFSAILRADLAAGLDIERPERTPERDSNGRWLRAGLSADLPLGFTAGLSAEGRRTRYAGLHCCPPTRDGRARTDRVRILRLTALNRAVTLLGFSPQLALVREVRESNAQAAGYRRNRAELRFQRQF